MKKILYYLSVFVIMCGVFIAINDNKPVDSKNKSIIKVEQPKEGSIVKSPLQIKGRAKGYWFFEGSAPVSLVNWDGLIIAEGYISAIGEWMSEDYVDFEGVINFKTPEYKNNGTLILRRHNASGLPEHDMSVEIPILFR
jgi:hypothetical protein